MVQGGVVEALAAVEVGRVQVVGLVVGGVRVHALELPGNKVTRVLGPAQVLRGGISSF